MDETYSQGDVFFRPVGSIPTGKRAVDIDDGKLIVTHSETGHHHVVDVDVIDGKPNVIMYADGDNPLLAWLEVNRPATVKHLRSFDTHADITLPAGRYEIRRQREYVPQGWRQVQD